MKFIISTDNHTATYTAQEQEQMLEYLKTLMHLGLAFKCSYEYTWQELSNTQEN